MTPARDVPARTALAHVPGTAGLPSKCPTSGDLVNAHVGGARTRAATARPAPYRFDVCVRAASGSTVAGGRLVVSAENVPGVTPFVTPGADLSKCTVPVLQATSPAVLDLLTSRPGSSPVSVCLRTAAGTQTYTVGVAGSPVVPDVRFEAHPG